MYRIPSNSRLIQWPWHLNKYTSMLAGTWVPNLPPTSLLPSLPLSPPLKAFYTSFYRATEWGSQFVCLLHFLDRNLDNRPRGACLYCVDFLREFWLPRIRSCFLLAFPKKDQPVSSFSFDRGCQRSCNKYWRKKVFSVLGKISLWSKATSTAVGKGRSYRCFFELFLSSHVFLFTIHHLIFLLLYFYAFVTRSNDLCGSVFYRKAPGLPMWHYNDHLIHIISHKTNT